MEGSNQDNHSNDISNRIKTTKVVYPQIYSYILPDEHDNDGSQKIGHAKKRGAVVLKGNL